MGDAISHAVLPGIVLGFLVAGTRATWPIFLGALATAVVTAVAIDLVRRFGRLDSGTAMGVVFSIMFAAGVVLMEQAAAHSVDLDAECVLYGQLEDILWLAPQSWSSLLEPAVWADLPREVITLAVVTADSAQSVALFYKELSLMVLVGAVAVAAFEAVGSILVIAMFICPAAAARMFTDRLITQIGLSLLLAAIAAIGGYIAAAWAPFWLGSDHSLGASGMVAVATGVILAAAVLFAPRHGVLLRRRRARVAARLAPAG